MGRHNAGPRRSDFPKALNKSAPSRARMAGAPRMWSMASIDASSRLPFSGTVSGSVAYGPLGYPLRLTISPAVTAVAALTGILV